MQIGGFDHLQFKPGTHPSVAAKAEEVVSDVNNVAGKLMSVDDRIDIDMNGRMGEVKVSNLSFNDAPSEKISGKLSFDPSTQEKKEMYAEVKEKTGILSSPKVILEYDKDYQSIPIFGSKKERFEKRTQDDVNAFKSLVQIVEINPKTGLAEYSEYIQDNTPMPPTPDPFPHPGPFPNPHPGHNPHPGPNPHPSPFLHPGPNPHPSPGPSPHPGPKPTPGPSPHSGPGGGHGIPGGHGGFGGPGHNPGGFGGPGGHGPRPGR